MSSCTLRTSDVEGRSVRTIEGLAGPELEIELISPRDIPPAGAGETALIVGPAAIANALPSATGRRHTSLPIRSGTATA